MSTNIVLIMVDQLSAKWFEAAQAGVADLPNLRRLQQQGVTFTQAFTPNPLCSPARATIATGLSSLGHGVIENGYSLSPDIPNFMQALRRQGYQCGALGKVHFQPHYQGFHHDLSAYGFNHQMITEDHRGGPWLDWIRDQHPDYLDQALATIWAANIPEWAIYGDDEEDLRPAIQRAKQQMGPSELPWGYPLPLPQELSQTEWITTQAERFITDNKDQSFFAHISYVQPHGPFTPPTSYIDRVNTEDLPLPLAPSWREHASSPQHFHYDTKRNKPDAVHRQRQLYFADLIHLDEQVGRILDCLEQINQLEQSYIIFTADHGELLGDHGLWKKEHRHYDAGIRVPLIVSGPTLPSNTHCTDIIQHQDICPSIINWGHCTFPLMPRVDHYRQPNQPLQPLLPGYTIEDILSGKQKRDCMHIISYNDTSSEDPRQWARTIRTRSHRYTWYPCDGGEQLFDLQNDPDELNNLIGNPAREHIRNELQMHLLEQEVLQLAIKPRSHLFALGAH